ncbi:hypothetical protein D3C75_256310 [compost metagenome]
MKNKVVMAIMILSLITSLLTFAQSYYRTAEGQGSADRQIRNAIFDLSDRQMKQAIATGSGDLQSVKAFQTEQQAAVTESNQSGIQPSVNVNTPYYYIAMMSYSALSTGQEYTLSEARKLNKQFSDLGQLGFSIKASGDNARFTEHISITLKQGSTVMQPDSITGKDERADEDSAEAGHTGYSKILIPYFDTSRIDFSKPAELIYLDEGQQLPVTYQVDFAKIK